MMEELYHHGIKGQKWGVRRYQNEDGTLTEEGKLRYLYNADIGGFSANRRRADIDLKRGAIHDKNAILSRTTPVGDIQRNAVDKAIFSVGTAALAAMNLNAALNSSGVDKAVGIGSTIVAAAAAGYSAAYAYKDFKTASDLKKYNKSSKNSQNVLVDRNTDEYRMYDRGKSQGYTAGYNRGRYGSQYYY